MSVESRRETGRGPTGSVPPRLAVIFDLDGVLVDSSAVAEEAFAVAYAEVVGDGPVPLEEYRRHEGRYFPDIVRIMGLPSAMTESFVRESHRLGHQATVWAGVVELLAELRERNLLLAVATGKSGTRARSLLRDVGLLDFFAHVVGSDEVARAKPAPDIVRRALDLMGVPAARTVMVGDAPNDLISAQGAGVVAAAATWGTLDERELLGAGPDLVLRHPGDLLACCPAVAGS